MMLINTVLLFLQNALPIFIITTLLLVTLNSSKPFSLSSKFLVFELLLSSIAIMILSTNLEVLSQKFDGKGIEVFLAVCYSIVYLLCVGLFIINRKCKALFIKKLLAFKIFLIICTINGSNFVIYLTNYWTQVQQVEPMIIGIILGSGICLSIAILLYLSLKSADNKIYIKTSKYFLLFFALGQLMHSVVMLQQVDILPSVQPIWDTSGIISEKSEIGQFLMVLFGYETTPSLLQITLYVVAFIVPVMISKLNHTSILMRGAKP
jgi:high-affinity iron transporter